MGLDQEPASQGSRSEHQRHGLREIGRGANQSEKMPRAGSCHLRTCSRLSLAPREVILLTVAAAMISVACCRAAHARSRSTDASLSLAAGMADRSMYRRLHQEGTFDAHARISPTGSSDVDSAAQGDEVRRGGERGGGDKNAHEMVSYMVCVDAGSSGSRVHVFKMKWRHGDRELPEIELPSKKLKVVPGLSTYEKAPRDAGGSLLELIAFAKSHVPQSMWAQTPFIVAATAGLRLLTHETARGILESCEQTLRTRSPFHIESSNIVLLSGDDEGVFGWLSINFLAQRLRGMKHAQHAAVGAVEVGGASLQVTGRVKLSMKNRENTG
jgi:hypothetical protein